MERLTYKKVKDGDLPGVLGYCSTDARFRRLLNAAHKRLVHWGKSPWAWQQYEFCTDTNDCSLVWPRQVAAIEAYAINGCPQKLFNSYYRYLGAGYGLLKSAITS